MKLFLKIFNVVYLAIAAIAICCFLTQPYIDLKGSYNLEPANITSMVKEAAGKDITEQEIQAIVGDTAIGIDIQAKVEAKYVFNFNDKETLKNSIVVPFDNTKQKVMTDLSPIVENAVERTARNIAKKVIIQSVEQKIAELSPETDVQKAMSDANLDDAYFESFAGEVYAEATKENATIDKVNDNVVSGKMIDISKRLAEQAGLPEFADTTKIGGEMSAQVKEQMKSKFIENEFCDSEGNIVNIKEKIRSEIQSKLNLSVDEYATSFSEYSLYYFIVMWALIAPWLALAIFSIIRIIRRKKVWVKTWYLFVFASIQLILGVGLTIAVNNFLPKIAGVLPLGDFQDVLSTLKLSVVTSSFIPSILYLVMIPLVIVYTVFAHKAKKQYKREKKAK